MARCKRKCEKKIGNCRKKMKEILTGETKHKRKEKTEREECEGDRGRYGEEGSKEKEEGGPFRRRDPEEQRGESADRGDLPVFSRRVPAAAAVRGQRREAECRLVAAAPLSHWLPSVRPRALSAGFSAERSCAGGSRAGL